MLRLALITSVVVSSSGLALAAPPAPPLAAQSLVRARFGAAAEVRWDASLQAPKSLRGLSVATVGKDAGERAVGFVHGARDIFGVGPSVDVVPVETVAPAGRSVVRMNATYDGLVVEGRTVVVTLDAAQRVTSVTSDLGPLSVPRPAAVISPEAAKQAVAARFVVAQTGIPTQVVVANGTAGRVAWRVPAMVVPLTGHFFVWVDAETGAILREAPAGADQTMQRLPERGPAEDAP
ncbi:MAG: hypothetical protein U1F43_30920 [Myxococcota bacterium]